MRYQIKQSRISKRFYIRDTHTKFETESCITINELFGLELSLGEHVCKSTVVYEFNSKEQFKEEYPEEFI